jgi:hypothetical protein
LHVFPSLHALAAPQARRRGRPAPFRHRPPWMPAPPPDPLDLLACSLALRRALARKNWRPVQRVRVRRRTLRHAPPHSGMLTTALRLQASRALRSCVDGPDHVPLRVMRPVYHGPMCRAHGAVHGARARRQSLDPRSTVLLWRFPLRAPEFSQSCMPVFPPRKILAVRF